MALCSDGLAGSLIAPCCDGRLGDRSLLCAQAGKFEKGGSLQHLMDGVDAPVYVEMRRRLAVLQGGSQPAEAEPKANGPSGSKP